jgi:hypothetical protein
MASEMLKAAALRRGIEVLEVNPAYTSTIGATNYARRFGASIHAGAACAIARRSMRLSERPAVRTGLVPARNGAHVTVVLQASVARMYGRNGLMRAGNFSNCLESQPK